MTRRTFLAGAASTIVAGAIGAVAQETAPAPVPQPQPLPHQNGASPWPLVLNTSTLRPAPLSVKIEAAKEAGYDGIELWIDELEKYEADGGSLKDLARQLQDLGLMVPNVIGLWDSMPPTEEAFQASLVPTRNRIRMAAEVGSQHVAAIATPDRPDFSLEWGIRCYREILRIGRDEFGIIPAFEFVGFFQGVYRLGQAAGIALDVDDPDACLIMDTFHLYRGGSGFNGLKLLNGRTIADFHWNDVPVEPARTELTDAHRVLPGDGILPLAQVLRDLCAIGYTGPLSLEIFHRELWEKDPKDVAKLGLEKMRASVAQAA